MGESVVRGDGGAWKLGRPTTISITVPPRGSTEALFSGGSGIGFSPGPMTMVSNFFSEQGPFSFSQLLAGAMASPMPKLDDSRKEKEGAEVGYKRNRPQNLVVAQPQLQLEPQGFSPLFMFPPGLTPSGFLNSPGFLSPLQSPFGMSHQQALAHVTAQAALSQSYMQIQAEFQNPSVTSAAEAVAKPSSTVCETSARTNSLSTETESLNIEPSEISQSDKKSLFIRGDKLTSDGYNWRKYGQKHVKASECPRSYYKCTHLNCPVKKKVEGSFDGHITEITYKGQHNHDPPLPNKRGKDVSALDRTINCQVKPDFASQGHDGSSRITESLAVHSIPENFQPTATINSGIVDTAMLVDDTEDEPNAKRRNMDVESSISASSHQTVIESKIVVQTRSEVDLLDDGYRWRKYGQKMVKGNPHPRSYYRCTYSGCNVRKHVERASADPKAVITTYEGKHNHEIPTGKYSSYVTAHTSSQKLKTQPTAAEDRIPVTLQLKEEHIVA